ncbi:MAG: phosphotransferase [Gemmataceae bacterium]
MWDRHADHVLGSYASFLRGRRLSLDNAGGFSGALLWKIESGVGSLCLRASSPSESPRHLADRHHLMALARDRGMTFVPRVHRNAEGNTVSIHAGRAWELMEWLPGSASYQEHPTQTKLTAAVVALARLHREWASGKTRILAECPAVERRIRAWKRHMESSPGILPLAASDLYQRIQAHLNRWLVRVPEILGKPAASLRVHPCLRDIWHDHLLFTGEELTGLVDYAGVGEDNPAVDLARMLGSLCGDDEDAWEFALAHYREMGDLTGEEARLARRLDQSGVILALANWRTRLEEMAENKVGFAPKLVSRVESLLARVDRWK